MKTFFALMGGVAKSEKVWYTAWEGYRQQLSRTFKETVMTHQLPLYPILKRILSELNEHIVDHGDRVAYLYLKMGQFRGRRDDLLFEHMMLACYAHDIGAYKTEKFLDLLRFDVSNTLEHCIYGYLFMKYFSPLREDAQVLIYHHSFYNEREKFTGPLVDEGILIHFLDRIDILTIRYPDDEDVYRQIRSVSGLNFNPQDVEDFIAADKKYHLIDHLRSGTCSPEVEAYFNLPEHSGLLEPVINMLAYEIDFRSEQTVIHTITTTLFAADLAGRMHLPPDEIEDISFAARLHDLGKVDVPREIVEKPGRLTADEYEIMKKHAAYTGQIIHGLFPEHIVRAAARHHERLDGSGYPEGLTGEQLTVGERIIQVADVASALLQKRSYKDEMDKETVLKILNEEGQKGRLDREIVTLFADNFDQIVGDVRSHSARIIALYEGLQDEYKQYLREFSSANHEGFEEFGLFAAL